MKTQLNQILTIALFFTMTIGSTLAVSWGMVNFIYPQQGSEIAPKEKILMIKTQSKIDLSKTFKFFIPKMRG
jgi:hypothetical protein